MVESFSVVNQKVSDKEGKNLPVLKTQSHSPLSSVFFFFWHIYKFSSLCLYTPLILYLTFKQWHIVSLGTYCGPIISMLMTVILFLASGEMFRFILFKLNFYTELLYVFS